MTTPEQNNAAVTEVNQRIIRSRTLTGRLKVITAHLQLDPKRALQDLKSLNDSMDREFANSMRTLDMLQGLKRST